MSYLPRKFDRDGEASSEDSIALFTLLYYRLLMPLPCKRDYRSTIRKGVGIGDLCCIRERNIE